MSEHLDPNLSHHEPAAASSDLWNGTAQEVADSHPAVTTRRGFLFKVALGLNALVGAVLAVPIVGYLLGPALKKEDEINKWISLGSLEDFPKGKTRFAEYSNPVVSPSDGMTARIACWVRRLDDGSLQVFAVNCAHLGCPVRWFEQSRLFLCPCHGGAYYEDGTRASGPPTRGLFTYQTRVANGEVQILAGQLPTFATEACNRTATQKSDLVQSIARNTDGRPAWNG
jgi:Rieske Fe-S protein